jgi:hypothetical protein
MHGGKLHVESQEGEYTRMIIDLPACKGNEPDAKNNSSTGKVHD